MLEQDDLKEKFYLWLRNTKIDLDLAKIEDVVDKIPMELLFDPTWYAAAYELSPDHTQSFSSIFDHYINTGAREGHNPNIWFNEQFYLSSYPDVRASLSSYSCINGYHHYLLVGMRKHYSPSETFSEYEYLISNQDVFTAVVDNIIPSGIFHYILFGRNEQRLPISHKDGRVSDFASLDDVVELPFDSAELRDEIVEPSSETLVVQEFLAQAQLEPNGQPFGFNSLGRDPQFLVLHGFKAGYCRITVDLKFDGLLNAVKQIAMMQIFFYDVNGINEGNSWKFRIKDDDFRVEFLAFNANDVERIRFDPIDARCSFRIEKLSLSPVPFNTGFRHTIDNLFKLSISKQTRILEDLSASSDNALKVIAYETSGAISHRAGSYESWMEARILDKTAIEFFERRIDNLESTPVISILVPTYKPHSEHFKRAIESVIAQNYPYWELCVVDDGSPNKDCEIILAPYVSDPRFKVQILSQNSGISAATNAALALATGSFIALLDHDDELAPHALFAMVQQINKFPDVDMLYSDEDKMDDNGKRYGPFFKPDWAPEFMLSCMYTCHLGVYRRSLVEELGGFRSEFDFAQDYDLALRVSASARRILHVPDILYHWRATVTSTASGAEAKPTAQIAASRAVQDAIRTKGLAGEVIPGPFAGTHRVVIDIGGNPLVSIVIPTAARRIDGKRKEWYVLNLLRSIKSKTTYKNLEIILVHNGDIEPSLEAKLKFDNLKLVHYDSSTFNIAEKMNLGVANASGEYVILLNDDMSIISKAWVQEMLMWFSDPGVAGVGAKLLFPNDTIQHAGVLLLAQGPSHPYYGMESNHPGLAGSAVLVRNYTAVTGACMMVRKSTYLDVGGFDPAFRVNYNDVDFCLKVGKHGRIVYTPYAALYHYESVSKDEAPLDELTRFNERWSDMVGFDPAYNRNLSQSSSISEIADPPRTLYDDY